MRWQDIVLSVAQLVFLLALIPSVCGQDKPALPTSLVTAATMSVVTGTYATLGLYWSTASAGGVALLWWVLFVQVARREPAPSLADPGFWLARFWRVRE